MNQTNQYNVQLSRSNVVTSLAPPPYSLLIREQHDVGVITFRVHIYDDDCDESFL